MGGEVIQHLPPSRVGQRDEHSLDARCGHPCGCSVASRTWSSTPSHAPVLSWAARRRSSSGTARVARPLSTTRSRVVAPAASGIRCTPPAWGCPRAAAGEETGSPSGRPGSAWAPPFRCASGSCRARGPGRRAAARSGSPFLEAATVFSTCPARSCDSASGRRPEWLGRCLSGGPRRRRRRHDIRASRTLSIGLRDTTVIDTEIGRPPIG
jgi:hypothetical protein